MAEQEAKLSPRKSVFISYAHRDNREDFVSRLGYALDMYMDAFWDIKLQAGSWDKQLINKIEICDAFLVVMSHFQKFESEWCQKELKLAHNAGKTIIPIRRFDNYCDDELEKLQYADFSSSFDEGFKELTYQITGFRRTSWEYLDKQDEEAIFRSLANGTIPALIVKEFGEWLIVTRLWSAVQAEMKGDFVTISAPYTSNDVLRSLYYLREQRLYQPSRSCVEKAGSLVNWYVSTMALVSDTDHELAGQNVFTLLTQIDRFLSELKALDRDFEGLSVLQRTHTFDVASKLRELILFHSRRSRHLY